MEQTREPCKGHAHDSAITEIDPHAIGVEANGCRISCGKSHSTLFLCALGWSPQFPTNRGAFEHRNRHCKRPAHSDAAKTLLLSHPFLHGYGQARAEFLHWHRKRTGNHVRERRLASRCIRSPKGNRYYAAVDLKFGKKTWVVERSPRGRRVMVRTVMSSSWPKAMACCEASPAVGFLAKRVCRRSKP